MSNAPKTKVGDRVQLHPATSAWMRGDKFGTVVCLSHDQSKVFVRLDKSGRDVRMAARNILEVL